MELFEKYNVRDNGGDRWVVDLVTDGIDHRYVEVHPYQETNNLPMVFDSRTTEELEKLISALKSGLKYLKANA